MQSISKDEVNVTATGIRIEIKNQGGVYAGVLTGTYKNVSL